jgi:ABC-type multidrug transport system ATPase subunit
VIRIDHLVKRFGRARAVDDVSLDIEAGRSVALWGPNGAGKSTIIRCTLGLLRHTGRISIGPFDTRRSPKRARRLVGYVPQELGFYDEMGVGDAVCFFARLKGLRPRGPAEALASVGLTGHAAKRVRELSGGMKQRLALAIALLGDPPVLVLDEVTASLDACGRDEFIALLARLRAAGKTMLFASHRVDEVTALADRVVLLEAGRVVREVPASSLGAELGLDTVLHLHIAPSAVHRAAELLVASGFPSRLNGVGLYVPVPSGQKSAPFRVLAEGRIAIDDFEVLNASPKEGHA